MPSKLPLLALFDEVSERSAALASALPTWPCRSGCDRCCRTLARVPDITRSEWALLSAALDMLNSEETAAVQTRVEELARQVRCHGEKFSVTCPLLDRAQGKCLVYEGRPLGCRTYGFYRAHHHDAFCELVESHVTAQGADLVFGNYEVAEHALIAIDSERRSLLVWLSERTKGQPNA